MSGAASAVELAATQEAAVAEWKAERDRLNAAISELAAEEQAASSDWFRLNPSKRPDATSKPVRLRRQLDELAQKRDRLDADIRAAEAVLEESQEAAAVEREAQEIAALQAEIKAAEAAAVERWSAFVDAVTVAARELWPLAAESFQRLDSLPAGVTPIAPAPADFLAAVGRALTEPGAEPFADLPRVVASRIATTRSGGGAVDATGRAHTMGDLSTSDWSRVR